MNRLVVVLFLFAATLAFTPGRTPTPAAGGSALSRADSVSRSEPIPDPCQTCRLNRCTPKHCTDTGCEIGQCLTEPCKACVLNPCLGLASGPTREAVRPHGQQGQNLADRQPGSIPGGFDFVALLPDPEPPKPSPADAPEVNLPAEPAPFVPPPPSAIGKLDADQLYVLDAKLPFVVTSEPQGILKQTPMVGPITIHARFYGNTVASTRTYANPNIVVVSAVGSGRTTLLVYPAGVKTEGGIIRRTLDVGGPAPVPPGPTPPGPTPSPAPIPVDGFRVMIVYETADLAKYPQGQLNVMYSESDTGVRAYCRAKCAKGADGKSAEVRFFDQNVDSSNESKLWQDALKRPRTSLPWIVVSNGKSGFEGPLPASVAETLELLKKHGEGK